MGKKLVILAALNGGAQQDRDGAHVPITPAEIATAAHECYKTGASVVHIHARGEDKRPTTDLNVFSEIIKRIRDKCDILIQTTNGFGVRFDPDTGHAFGLNPISVFVWQRLDGKHTVQDILSEMKDTYRDVPHEAENHLREFISNLLQHGLAGYEYQT